MSRRRSAVATEARRQAEATVLLALLQDVRGDLTTVQFRRYAADARDMTALVMAALRLYRRWHARDYSPLVGVLRRIARHIASEQPARDKAFRARRRAHLRVVRGGAA